MDAFLIQRTQRRPGTSDDAAKRRCSSCAWEGSRAATAGLDVGAIVNGLNQPLPLVRFSFLVQKASEICQEVKSLGNCVLSAMEKEDSEALALLRARHERIVMEMVEHVKYVAGSHQGQRRLT